MENLTTIAAFLCVGICIVSCFFEKRLRASYNGAFGLIGALLFSSGFLGGIAALCLGIADALNVTYIFPALICLALSVLIFFVSLRRAPVRNSKPLPMMLAMLVVGLAAWVKLTIKIFAWFLRTFMHINVNSANEKINTFADRYTTSVTGGHVYRLWSAHGNYAVLKDRQGNFINVYPHGSDGIVSDDAGNLYYPG